MRKPICLMFFVLIATTIVSCTGNKPEISIGSMAVKQHSLIPLAPELSKYCGEYYSFGKEPGTQTFDCEIPLIPKTEIAFGWGAKDATQLDSNWNAMTWELYIDDVQVSLDKFELSNTGGEDSAGNKVKVRGWTLDLVNPSPGKHTLRLLWKSETPIDDGFETFAPGTYESIVNFTVLEK